MAFKLYLPLNSIKVNLIKLLPKTINNNVRFYQRPDHTVRYFIQSVYLWFYSKCVCVLYFGQNFFFSGLSKSFYLKNLVLNASNLKLLLFSLCVGTFVRQKWMSNIIVSNRRRDFVFSFQFKCKDRQSEWRKKM